MFSIKLNNIVVIFDLCDSIGTNYLRWGLRGILLISRSPASM